MKKIYLPISMMLVLMAVSAILFINNSFADSTGHGKGTGSPDEVTCSQSGCHGAGGGNGVAGVADNAAGGSITLNTSSMPGGTYALSTTYTLSITINDPSCLIAGFSCVAEDEGLASVGTMVITDNVHTHTAGASPINKNYITHSGLNSPAPGTATYGNPATFTFSWTSPSTNVGPITFYYVGIAGNNNQLEDGGDHVYKGSTTINPTVPLSTPTVNSSVVGFTLRSLTGGASPAQPFFVGGHALTGNITISIPSPFEVSLSPTSGFSGSLTLNQSGGTVTGTKVWVRYNNALAGSSPQTLTISSPGATSKTVSITGQTATPVIQAPTPTVIPQFTTTVGTPSVCDSFTITLSSLIDTFKITASSNFEISHNRTRSYVASEFVVPFAPFYGFTNFKVYVRYNPASAGLHSGTVTISSTGATSKVVNVSGISTSTGIPKFDFTEKDLKVYPNPAHDNARLAFTLAKSKKLEFKITDITGKVYATQAAKTFTQGLNEVVFETASLPAGTYFISAIDEGRSVHKMFVKQ